MAECECEDITVPKRLWVSYMTHGQRQVLTVWLLRPPAGAIAFVITDSARVPVGGGCDEVI
jgi:hypothetical protein